MAGLSAVRLADVLGALSLGARGVREALRAHCQVTEQIARRLALPEDACLALRQVSTTPRAPAASGNTPAGARFPATASARSWASSIP